ncbi:MAG TPA: hypothetical protein QGF58_19180 [Myxococcota bacterium]|nr:hypothetical protein [Myxococcota bacterium]
MDRGKPFVVALLVCGLVGVVVAGLIFSFFPSDWTKRAPESAE